MVLSNRPETSPLSLDLNQQDLDLPVCPPTDIESDEPELESTLHLKQLILLFTCLEFLWRDRTDFFVGANLTVYYKEEQLEGHKSRGPDFFVVLDTERRERKSWVVWGEGGKYPNLIIELLSDGTAKKDQGEKKQVYQNVFRTPEYFWFHPDTIEFQGWRWSTQGYEEIPIDPQGWRWSEQLHLFLGVVNRQLRFFTTTGELVLTPEEAATQAQESAAAERQRAEAERQRAAAERQRAEAERQRAEELLRRLREAGLEPE